MAERENADDLLRITARYVEELRAGQQPQLGDYLARYPQYADEIADFVAYSLAIESDLPPPAESAPPLPPELDRALKSAWQRIQSPGEPAFSSQRIASLLLTAQQQGLSPTQLAAALHLSEDTVNRLEERSILAASIPAALIERLASTLRQPQEALRAYFAAPRMSYTTHAKVAEPQPPYDLESNALPSQTISFREALEQSNQITPEQKAAWRTLLNQESP